MRNVSGNCRRLVSAGAGILVAASALGAQTPADPWAKTVALPTACYASQDQFRDKNRAAVDVATADADKQRQSNEELSRSWGAKAGEDPMATAALMQEAMMKDPQAAMKLMQQSGAAEDPVAAQAASMQRLNRESQMQNEGKALIESYKAAVATALKPARAHFAALRKRLGITEGWGVGEGASAKDNADYDAIKREADQAYAAMCPQWWGATGSMSVFMKRYKDYLVGERIPYDEKTESKATAGFALQGIDASKYKSTATLDAVRDYIILAGTLYDERPEEPYCAGTKCRDLPGI